MESMFTVDWKLDNSYCPKHKKEKQEDDSLSPCKFTQCDNGQYITIFGSKQNYKIYVPNIYCGNTKSVEYNLLKHIDKIEKSKEDYIHLKIKNNNNQSLEPFFFIISKQSFITLELYSLINIWNLSKCGENPGDWRKKLINFRINESSTEFFQKSQKMNVKELHKTIKQNVIKEYLLSTIEDDLYVNNYKPAEKKIDNICYRMGGNSMQFDWTFDCASNTYDKYSADDLKEEEDEHKQNEQEINEHGHYLVHRQLNHLNAAWLVIKNKFEMILKMKPTPNASEKHQHCVPELADELEHILEFGEKNIDRMILKCDGLQKNVGFPQHIINALIEKHKGHLFKGYNLKDLYQNTKVCLNCFFYFDLVNYIYIFKQMLVLRWLLIIGTDSDCCGPRKY